MFTETIRHICPDITEQGASELRAFLITAYQRQQSNSQALSMGFQALKQEVLDEGYDWSDLIPNLINLVSADMQDEQHERFVAELHRLYAGNASLLEVGSVLASDYPSALEGLQVLIHESQKEHEAVAATAGGTSTWRRDPNRTPKQEKEAHIKDIAEASLGAVIIGGVGFGIFRYNKARAAERSAIDGTRVVPKINNNSQVDSPAKHWVKGLFSSSKPKFRIDDYSDDPLVQERLNRRRYGAAKADKMNKTAEQWKSINVRPPAHLPSPGTKTQEHYGSKIKFNDPVRQQKIRNYMDQVDPSLPSNDKKVTFNDIVNTRKVAVDYDLKFFRHPAAPDSQGIPIVSNLKAKNIDATDKLRRSDMGFVRVNRIIQTDNPDRPMVVSKHLQSSSLVPENNSYAVAFMKKSDRIIKGEMPEDYYRLAKIQRAAISNKEVPGILKNSTHIGSPINGNINPGHIDLSNVSDVTIRAEVKTNDITEPLPDFQVLNADIRNVRFHTDVVAGDGNCFYRSIAKGLENLGVRKSDGSLWKHGDLRQLGLDYMSENPTEFKTNTFENPNINDDKRAFHGYQDMPTYVNIHRVNGHYACRHDAEALSKALGINICIRPSGDDLINTGGKAVWLFPDQKADTIYVSHEGQHYNHLQPKDPANIKEFEDLSAYEQYQNLTHRFPGIDTESPEFLSIWRELGPTDINDLKVDDVYDFVAHDPHHYKEAKRREAFVRDFEDKGLNIRRIEHESVRQARQMGLHDGHDLGPIKHGSSAKEQDALINGLTNKGTSPEFKAASKSMENDEDAEIKQSIDTAERDAVSTSEDVAKTELNIVDSE